MIKERGDKKVETWTHERSGFETDIYLRGTEFVATLLQKSFNAPDIAMLRKQMRDYAEHWITMEWFPIIELEVEEGDGRRYSGSREKNREVSIKFNFERFLISQSPAGMLFSVNWEIHPDHRKAEMSQLDSGHHSRGRGIADKIKLITFPLVAPLKKSDNSYWMTYTEELWARCQHIADSIDRMRDELRDMISTNEGIAKFLSIGTTPQIMLTDAPEKKSTKKKQ